MKNQVLGASQLTSHTEETRDRFFSAWRVPATPKMQELIDQIIEQILDYETTFGIRKRKRKEADHKVFVETVTAVICDVVHYYLSGELCEIAITRSKRILSAKDRYKAPAMNKTLPELLDMLSGPYFGLIEQQLGKEWKKERRTTINIAVPLLTLVHEHQISLEDIGYKSHRELIYLKEAKKDRRYKAKSIDYEDTPQTEFYRRRLGKINDLLERTEVTLNGVPQHDKFLRQIFTCGSFNCGGRAFGGFWQSTSKQDRKKIQINGEPVIELDYGQINPMIAYGKADLEPPEGDLYTVPGFEEHRDEIKTLLNCMFWADKPITRWPKGLKIKGYSVREVTTAIEKHHLQIRDKFYCGHGHSLQHTESSILLAVLDELREKGIPALPIHDSVIIQEQYKGMTLEVMRKWLRIIAKLDPKIK